jgi:peptidoglycan hydrolase-like protein with peptidoglycan-binding domain
VKRSLILLGLLAAGAPIFAQPDNNIATAQTRLKAEGFYRGEPSGRLDDQTVAALRQFQIRHRLVATGRIDAPTAKELNAAAPKPEATPQTLTGSWRELPNGEMQFVQEQPTEAAPATTASSAMPSASPQPQAAPQRQASPQPPAAPPAEGPVRDMRLQSPPPRSDAATRAGADTAAITGGSHQSSPFRTPSAAATGATTEQSENTDQFRDYVETFVQAGLDQSGGPEANFFADTVDYFGRPGIAREEVRRDLVRYNEKWPHRKFRIDGEIRIDQQPGSSEIKLTFPLAYKLRNGSRYATGRVLKSLTLTKLPNNQLQITAVNEWKAP